MEMTSERWRYTSAYLDEVFGVEDAGLEALQAAADAAGLPRIAVSGSVGRLLALLTSMTEGRRGLELGTLAGYSAAWLARGLRPDGHLTTVERDPAHAEVAERALAGCGHLATVEVRRGEALEVLRALAAEWPPGSVDVVFLDADKREYPEYFRRVRALIAPGGLLLADNALGSAEWWIDHEDDPHRAGADALNRAVAADPDFEAAAVPLREGLLVARRRR